MATLTGKEIVEHLLEARRKEAGAVVKGEIPIGIAFHAIERSVSLGSGGSLEGQVLIETQDGQFRKINGEKLLLLYKHFPDFVKAWKLSD